MTVARKNSSRDIENGTKRCYRCREWKNADESRGEVEFHRNRGTRDGLSNLCKPCAIESGAKYREKHPEKVDETLRKYREKNRATLNKKRKLYYDQHTEKAAESKRRYGETTKGILGNIKRGAKRRGIGFDLDEGWFENEIREKDGLCYYTLKPLSFARVTGQVRSGTLDRLDSSKGYTKENSVLCNLRVNLMKGKLTVPEFCDMIEELYPQIDRLRNDHEARLSTNQEEPKTKGPGSPGPFSV